MSTAADERMRVGFTGTREDFTEPQLAAFRQWVAASPMAEFHHGACIGADAGAVLVVDGDAVKPRPRIEAHPSTLRGMTDAAAVEHSDVVHDPKPPLDRNRDIVDAADLLAACPRGPEEQRSGTWATVRYARLKRVPVVIFWPDGTVT